MCLHIVLHKINTFNQTACLTGSLSWRGQIQLSWLVALIPKSGKKLHGLQTFCGSVQPDPSARVIYSHEPLHLLSAMNIYAILFARSCLIYISSLKYLYSVNSMTAMRTHGAEIGIIHRNGPLITAWMSLLSRGTT